MAFRPSIGETLNSFWQVSHAEVYKGVFRPPLSFDTTGLTPFTTRLPEPDQYHRVMSSVIAVRTTGSAETRQVALLGRPSSEGRHGAGLVFRLAAEKGRVLDCMIMAGLEVGRGAPPRKQTIARVPLTILAAEGFIDEAMYMQTLLPDAESLISAAGATVIAAAVHLEGPSSPVLHDQL